jgi:hypothetical protein
MERFEIDHPHNEASGILHLSNRTVTDRYGWQEAFWIVSDEGEAHQAVGALGRTTAGGWEVVRLAAKKARRSSGHTTGDAEAIARAGGWVYVFGSQFGEKDGPLEPNRHWVARFNEGLLEPGKKRIRGLVRVERPAFLLHRLVNDALRDAGIALIERGEREADDQVGPARADAGKKGKKWRRRLRDEDHSINVEAATFLPHGRLLLGLRYPCTADGHPLVVEIDGIDRLFAKKSRRRRLGAPEVTRVAYLGNVGSRERPTGIRDLAQEGTLIHAITGDLDSDAEDSDILADHPEGAREVSCHHTFRLPRSTDLALEADLVRQFDADANVEGISVSDDGTVWYVHDSESIVLERVPPGEGGGSDASGDVEAPAGDEPAAGVEAAGELVGAT